MKFTDKLALIYNWLIVEEYEERVTIFPHIYGHCKLDESIILGDFPDGDDIKMDKTKQDDITLFLIAMISATILFILWFIKNYWR
jgi:hypothetical protein